MGASPPIPPDSGTPVALGDGRDKGRRIAIARSPAIDPGGRQFEKEEKRIMKPRFAMLVALVLVAPLFAGCGSDKITADTTPPLAPTIEGASMGEAVLGAWWAPNTEPDLAGYNVYATQNGTTWMVNTQPITQNFVAVEIPNGVDPVTVYVTAIDFSDNESSPSATLAATNANQNPVPRQLQGDQPQDNSGQ
jgi:hypothetical protein